MAVVFPCCQCKSELRIDEKDRGKKARCPRCGMIQPVEASEWELEKEPDPERPDESIDDPDNQETIYRPSPPNLLSGNADIGTTLEANSASVGYEMKTPDGSVYGPVDRTELDQWAEHGRVSSQCLVRVEGKTFWQSALNLYPQLSDLQLRPESPNALSSNRSSLSNPGIRIVDSVTDMRPNNGTSIFLLALLGLCTAFLPIASIVAFLWGARELNAIGQGTADSKNRLVVQLAVLLAVIGLTIFATVFLGLFG